MWGQLFRRSARPSLSLQGQIREMLVDAILSGILAPGESIPSSRELARHLGVARITVVLAYQQLARSEEHTSELQSQSNLVCRLLLEKKKAAELAPYRAHTTLRAGPQRMTN